MTITLHVISNNNGSNSNNHNNGLPMRIKVDQRVLYFLANRRKAFKLLFTNCSPSIVVLGHAV